MEILQNYDIYLGTIAGLLIHYDKSTNKSKVYLRNEKKCEISALSWGRKIKEILIGYNNGNCKILNLSTEYVKDIPDLSQSKIVGIVPIKRKLFIATNSGNIHLYRQKETELYMKNEDENKTIEKILLNPFNEEMLGVGGKNNDIKLYSIETKKPVFIAKSDRHDELELAQPVDVKSFTFLKNDAGTSFATVTRQGQIRLYDTRQQRRAIKIHKAQNIVYTAISRTCEDYEIVVGSNKGHCQIVDIRNQIKPVKTFKGCMGGVTDIVCDLEQPFAATCSLDRYFRLYNLKEKRLEYEEYIKIQSPLMIMRKGLLNISEIKDQNLIEQEELPQSKRLKIS